MSYYYKYIHSPYAQQHETFTQDQRSKVFQLKSEFGCRDEILNQFKLMIYKWKLNDALVYYKQDSFCNDYCIFKNWNYGCENQH